MHTLKVRDRTTGKLRDAMVDAEDHARLSQYSYLTDKNSDEPFRESVTMDGKRPRIALKRDVMGFQLGDPRRVCYVDKTNIFDCRKSNLKVKTEGKHMVKIVKTVDQSLKETKTEILVPTTVAATPTVTTIVPEETKSPMTMATLQDVSPTVSDMEIKRCLLSQVDYGKVIDLLSIDTLLGIWAESHGYEKKKHA